MQVRAIINAMIDAYLATGINPHPKIMVPLISTVEEFENQRALIFVTLEETFNSHPEVNRPEVTKVMASMQRTPLIRSTSKALVN